MSDRDLEPEPQANQIIEDVNASDLARARAAVAEGVEKAQRDWIPHHLIVSALALELQTCVSGHEPSSEVAGYLRKLADLISDEASSAGYH